MKKAFVLVLVLGAAFYLADYYFTEPEILRIGVECDYIPNNWVEDQQTDSNVPIVNDQEHYADGYDIQIAKFVAGKNNMKLEVKKLAWNDLLPSLNAGEIDAIFSGMLDTKPRRESADFSVFYDAVDNEYAVMVDKSSPYMNAETISDFAGAKIVGQEGTFLDDLIAQMEGVIHLPPTINVTDSIEMVNQHKADGAIINVDTGQAYQRKHDNLHMIIFDEGKGFSLDFTGTCAGVRKNDRGLLEKINKALNSLPKYDRKKMMDMCVVRAWKYLAK